MLKKLCGLGAQNRTGKPPGVKTLRVLALSLTTRIDVFCIQFGEECIL